MALRKVIEESVYRRVLGEVGAKPKGGNGEHPRRRVWRCECGATDDESHELD
jgi:hypothetical protein